MLYHLLAPLAGDYILFNLFSYISFRAAGAMLTALLFAFLVGPGIIARLDHLQRLGVNALYLNPVFTAPSNHKYDVADFDHVDPHLGGDGALGRLRQSLDARGMRYLLDVVPNHVGVLHRWFRAAQADPAAPEAEFFVFDEHPDRYANWLGVRTLPKLDYRSAELRRRMMGAPDAVLRRWLLPPFSADGWRIDVGNMLGRHGPVQLGAEVARAVRAAVKETRPDAYLLGEHFFVECIWISVWRAPPPCTSSTDGAT